MSNASKTKQKRFGGDKAHSCKMCDYKSENVGHLKQHMLIHTGEKLFNCSQCDYKSAYSSALKTHMLIHSGKKPFSYKFG